jgi:7-keto-8-aminopelargonate synthetase-like enzyme
MALAAHKALDLLSEMKLERVALRQTGRDLRDQLRAEGWNVGGTDSPIIPVYIGDPNRAVALSRQLMDKGCFVPAIRPPTVPQGESLLRISLSTAHRLGHIQQLLKSFHEIRQQSLLSMEKNRASDERFA